MVAHYFTPRPEGPEELFCFPLVFGDRTYPWWSARGVFAKDRLDFGSKLLLETAVVPATGRILDVGCGTGPMGLLAAVRGAGSYVCLVDVNERALGCARRNRESLGLAGRAGLIQGSFVSAFRSAAFAAVLFNPPIRVGKASLLEALSEMPRVLEPGGQLWVVVRKQQGGTSYLAHLRSVFAGAATVAARRKGYLVLRAGTPAADDMSAAGRGVGAPVSSEAARVRTRPPETQA